MDGWDEMNEWMVVWMDMSEHGDKINTSIGCKDTTV